MAKKFVQRAMALSVFIIAAAAAYATGNAEMDMAADSAGSVASIFNMDLLAGLIYSIIYSLLGLIILMVSFKVFDLVTPFDLNKEIAEDDNPAVGIAVAGIMIGLGLIVAAAIA